MEAVLVAGNKYGVFSVCGGFLLSDGVVTSMSQPTSNKNRKGKNIMVVKALLNADGTPFVPTVRRYGIRYCPRLTMVF